MNNSMDDEEINCFKCGSPNLEPKGEFGSQQEVMFCLDCKTTFPVEYDTRYAVADTSATWYILAEEDKYRRIFFENPELEKISEISRLYSNLSTVVNIPAKLLPICKLCHDLVKERIRDTLVYSNISQLSREEKDQLSFDPPHIRLNIRKLINDYMPKALSNSWPSFQSIVTTHAALIGELHWIRNKSEHVALSKWPIPSYVHADLNKMPGEVSTKNLNKFWLKETVLETVTFLNKFQKAVGIPDENLYTIILR